MTAARDTLSARITAVDWEIAAIEDYLKQAPDMEARLGAYRQERLELEVALDVLKDTGA